MDERDKGRPYGLPGVCVEGDDVIDRGRSCCKREGSLEPATLRRSYVKSK